MAFQHIKIKGKTGIKVRIKGGAYFIPQEGDILVNFADGSWDVLDEEGFKSLGSSTPTEKIESKKSEDKKRHRIGTG